MRKLVLAAAAVAALLAVGTSQNPVAAMPVAAPATLGVTAPDLNGVQQVYSASRLGLAPWLGLAPSLGLWWLAASLLAATYGGPYYGGYYGRPSYGSAMATAITGHGGPAAGGVGAAAGGGNRSGLRDLEAGRIHATGNARVSAAMNCARASGTARPRGAKA